MAMLFTCTLVLSCPAGKEGGLNVKHEPLEQTARYWVGQNEQGRHSWKKASKRFSPSLDRGYAGRIREVLQADGHSSMYFTKLLYDYIIMPAENNCYELL
jgi:hypothetical protein